MIPTRKRRRHIFISLLLIVLSLSVMGSASASPFPEEIELPPGFQPEGIASGKGTTFYVGSIPTGSIFQGDFRTGEGELLVEFEPNERAAIGLKYDPRSDLLFVAGGPTCNAYIYAAGSGDTEAIIPLTTAPCFINDVVITRDAAYFTNSFAAELYRIPLDKNGIPSTQDVEVITLGGEYQFTAGAFNANGIAATPNGKTLIIVNSTEGALYRVDPETGFATRIALAGGSVPAGDGILLHGKTLYVVQNRLNQVAVIELDPDLSSGSIETLITSPLFRVPTTIARFGNSLYVVNARFGTPPTPDTDYDVVLVPDE